MGDYHRVAAAGDVYVDDLVEKIGLDQTIDAKPRPRCKPTHRAGLWRQSREVVHLDFCADAEGDVAAFSLLAEDGDARRVVTGGIESRRATLSCTRNGALMGDLARSST